MKRFMIMSLAAVTLLGGCTTYAGSGAFSGATLGSVIGSAIGGITGGPRGSDVGTLIGMAGGAAIGGAVGAQADKKQQEYREVDDARFERKYREHREAATRGSGYGSQDDDRYYGDESGFDPEGRGDDVLYDFRGSDCRRTARPRNNKKPGRRGRGALWRTYKERRRATPAARGAHDETMAGSIRRRHAR